MGTKKSRAQKVAGYEGGLEPCMMAEIKSRSRMLFDRLLQESSRLNYSYLMSPSPEGPAAEAGDASIVPDELLARLGHLLAHETVVLKHFRRINYLMRGLKN